MSIFCNPQNHGIGYYFADNTPLSPHIDFRKLIDTRKPLPVGRLFIYYLMNFIAELDISRYPSLNGR